jgi:hypothetical protein
VSDPAPGRFAWPAVLSTLLARRDLDPDAASWAMEEILGGTANVQPDQFGGPCDMVYVDADHSYDGVKRDTALARESLSAAGGCIIWHDYHRDLPGVVRYLDELVLQNRPLVHVQGTRIVFEVVR